MHWDQGYVSEVGYVYGYYSELNPLQNKLSLIYNGIKPPEVKTACELGFGQGVSLLCNAASSNIDWYGNDFNPIQVAFVNDAIQASELELNVTDENFEQFCSRTDLPNFDYIALHGIWSWISDENRKIITRFISEKLNVGGVVYISYNAEPGRSGMRSFRELMQWHSTSRSAPDATISKKIDSAVNFMNKLMNVNPAFKAAYPLVEQSFKDGEKLGKDYLAHEYFNVDWEPMSIKRVSEFLSNCKLQFAASATHLELLPNIYITQEQRDFIQSFEEPIFKEYVKDMCINQVFRRDLWVKGGQRMSAAERMTEFLSLSVSLMQPVKQITFDIQTALGKASLSKDIYKPLIECLEGKTSMRISEINRLLGNKLSLTQLFEAIIVLAGKKALCIAQETHLSQRAIPKTKSLNNYFIQRSGYEQKVSFLVSPISATGVHVSRFYQLFLDVWKENSANSIALAESVWAKLKSQDEKIITNGEVLQTEEDNLQHLTKLATVFIEHTLPELKRLQIT